MDNAITIDVEDYYMVSAFSDVVKFGSWGEFESRVHRNVIRMLDILDEFSVKATFFSLGWIAENHPEVIREINSRGHEIGCHGYNHRLIFDLTPDEFREDTKRAKGTLEDLAGTKVKGYRAASYSIVEKSLWALDILLEEGFEYDSSIFPVRHDLYGIPSAERFPHFIEREGGKIMELPPSTYRVLGHNFPVAGGGYFRIFPLFITRGAISKINKCEKKPFIFYLHPWEIDVDQPRIDGGWKANMRHYNNLASTEPKLRVLLDEFSFKPLGEFLVE